MEILKILNERRSCKKYSDKLVSDELIEKIAEAGANAANGKGMQAPYIMVVTKPELVEKLSKLNAAVLGADIDPFYGAKQVIVVLADKSVPTYVYDGSLVMGNMMTAAEALGVDSCWIHRAKQVFDTEEGKAILAEAGITGDVEGIGNLVIGYGLEGGKKEKALRKEGYISWIK